MSVGRRKREQYMFKRELGFSSVEISKQRNRYRQARCLFEEDERLLGRAFISFIFQVVLFSWSFAYVKGIVTGKPCIIISCLAPLTPHNNRISCSFSFAEWSINHWIGLQFLLFRVQDLYLKGIQRSSWLGYSS